MGESEKSTLEMIHTAAKAEFMEKGFQAASLRNIVKTAGVTTGAFYGYYDSKEELFAALVDPAYEYMMSRYRQAHESFENLPMEKQPEQMGKMSAECMNDLLAYSFEQVLHYRKNLLLAAFSDAWQLIIESTHCVFLLYFLYKLAITNLCFIRVTGNDCSVSFIIKISQGGFSFEKRIQFKAASGLCRWLQVPYHSVMDFKCN